MNQANNETQLLLNALAFEQGHPRRTQHIMKVYTLARTIGEQERLAEKDLTILCASSILHDIAIKICKEKYNDACLKNQQKEAESIVPEMLMACDYDSSYYERILFLVKMHHCYDSIDGIDYQILVEADLLINLFEEPDLERQVPNLDQIFKTKTGRSLFCIFKKGH